MNEKDLLIKEEDINEKRKNERFAYILGIFTQFLWTINGLQLKDIQLKYKDVFTLNSVIFWRCVPVVIFSYLTCYYKNIRITPHSEIKHLTWFYFRSLGNYFYVVFNIKVLSYFRLSTSRVFLSCQPLITIFLSIIFLSEKFHYRYLIGILVGIFGSALIALNDKKPQSKVTIIEDNMTHGLICALLLLLIAALSSVGQKMITKDGMPVQVQNFYLGVYNGLPGFIMCLYERHFALAHFKYVLYCISNGFVFLAGHYLTTICYQYIAISKFLPVTYLVVVFTFFLSVTVLREPLFFTDILGASIIIGFQFYNLMYPPKRNNLNVNDNSNKENESLNYNNKADLIFEYDRKEIEELSD
jgi:drug/metabolite transporter (DMT)-like permease